ncbi:MAG: hydroxymethylbilane synthase [Acidimicrobiales bacterium]|jgi:hydroxymethylbilane synthase
MPPIAVDASLPSPLRLATRSSPLALVQVDLVAAALASQRAGASGTGAPAVAAVALQTAGDLRTDVPIHAVGGRGVFVKEVDDAVLAGGADASVHSAKDLPSLLDGRLVIAAYLPRADPRDALVGAALRGLRTGAVVASGSVRRRAQLAWLRPDLRFAELRGNMASRLAKVPAGGAVVVAMAALERLDLTAAATQVLSLTEMLPQIGQGAIAVCCRRDDEALRLLLQSIDHDDTRAEVEAERAWLRAVGGGCDAPVAAHARRLSSGGLHLEAMIASLDGHTLVREAMTGSNPGDLGQALAAEMLDRCGGRSLLEQAGIVP